MILCDINCDMGEGIGNDESLMPFITSANIACGYHAGDEETMKKMIDLCIQYKVAIGAHPSYPDRENFGRKDLVGTSISAEDVLDIVAEQIYSLQKIAVSAGTQVHHVKPHGALYNRAAKDAKVASFIARAIKETNSSLLFYGLSNSEMKQQAEHYGLKFINEVFADRTYQDDGSLTPRSELNALIEDDDTMIQQVIQMVNEGTVYSVSGKKIGMLAETICVHGDGEHAVDFAKKIHEVLKK